MASKRIQITFELTSEKEWRDFIKQPGLIVVDLYRDWAGPCVAMMTPLKQLKTSEMAYEWMHLASAPSSIVPDLQRLTGSKPTFVLLSGARLVNVIFGCNAPEVVRIITEEIEREKRAAEGLEKRKTVSLTKLSPAEVEYEERVMGSEGARLREERNRAQLEADRILRRILGEIAGNLPDTTVVVVFPYALQSDACEEILTSLRDTWAELGFTVAREEQMELTIEAANLMFWERRLPQHDVLLDTVTQGMSLVLMLERAAESLGEEEEEADDEEQLLDASSAADVQHVIARSIYGFLPGTGSSMELITPVDSETPAEETSLLEELVEDGGTEEERREEAGKAEEGEEDGEEHEGEDEGLGPEDEDGEEDGAEGQEEEQEDDFGEDEGIDKDGNEDEDGGEEGTGVDSAVQPLLEAQDEEDDEDGGLVVPQEPVRVWNPRELLPALDSAAARLLFRADEKGPVLPGVWTPLTALSKAAAVKALFEDVAEPLYHPPTPPPPPPPESTVICFAGDKCDEVLGLSENFPSEVTRFAFFTKSRKLLASSRADYEKLVRGGLQTAKTLVVLEVTRVRSAPLLELATAGPLYISATPAIAKADVDEFFGARVARAGQDDLRDIVKVQEGIEVEELVAPAKATPSTPPADADEAGEAGEAGEQVEGEAAVGEDGATLPEGQEQGLGDGEAVLLAEQEVEAATEGMGAEEQLLNEAGEGDAPEGTRRPSAGGEGDTVPAAEE
ncbi:Thioredoxin domain-containing protein 6 [Frankliniella fusca]|uniref:Thioredoxin domain-containing protein 6 n=1 Tax=Frankliniella fusca TaxID=407009 RepID=A0AAE1GV03_9NEOP|nr:Thioredoxin domain-containing protein 6 [Frankliniella fusca]